MAAATWTASVICSLSAPLFQRGGDVGVDAVGALDGVRHGQSDERLLAGRQRAFGEDGAVPGAELLPQLGGTFQSRKTAADRSSDSSARDSLEFQEGRLLLITSPRYAASPTASIRLGRTRFPGVPLTLIVSPVGTCGFDARSGKAEGNERIVDLGEPPACSGRARGSSGPGASPDRIQSTMPLEGLEMGLVVRFEGSSGSCCRCFSTI